MKAIILSSLILISFAAISSEVGQKSKPEDCTATAATDKREAKKAVAGTPADASSEDKKKVIGK